MAVKSIQLGQVWRKDDDGKDYLVTKVYSEVFTQYAVLRPAILFGGDGVLVNNIAWLLRRLPVFAVGQPQEMLGFSACSVAHPLELVGFFPLK